ncbi:hypothetical protein HMPREF1544_08039 [Mucor circinelloides 1006PhL]|uniref:Homeobox domain-containing protein n=1 Tax=Mucor circinelloides f. circinelloides (strain 1006PhL) TaxID=1220926 RepID=S2J9S7_MUCC1|nr:hypothetical protein HMPREF1544_08039 [Mucor circinelloides 1006PhL]
MTSLQQQHHQHQSWSQQLSDENAAQADQHQHQDASDRQDSDDIHQPDNNSGTNSTPPVRKRTRATADQLSVLEDTFAVNVSPNSKLRKQLAEQLQMSERSIQIWFQNRRAKVKHMQKRAQMQMHQASIRAQLYQYHQQQQQQYGQPLLPMQPNSSVAAAAAAAGVYQHPYYYSNAATRLVIPTRAQSVDAVQYNNARVLNLHQQAQPQPQDMLFTPASSVPPPPSTTTGTQYSATPPPMSYPQYYGHHQPGSAASSSSWPAHLQDDLPLTRQSMPPQVYPYDFNSSSVEPSAIGMEFPEYLHGQVSPSPSPLHQQQKLNATIPTLVSVPDAGPTAILATGLTQSSVASNHNSPTPAATLSTSPEASTNLGLSTIDPSNLMMPSAGSTDESNEKKESSAAPDNTSVKDESSQQLQQPVEAEQQQQQEDEEPKDLYLSATTLTIGTWHRLKMHETDLVCVYRPDTRIFAWHIVDGGCHFKMEVAQNAVSSIEFVLDEHEALADVHFDISEPPLFYMESTATTTTTIPLDESSAKKKTNNSNNKKNEKDDTTTAEEPEQEKTIEIPSPMWVQCSDFTEGKQASRFFRHTLKGVAHHMKQELLALIHNHEETRRLVHFIEPQQYNLMYQPIVESQSSHPHQHPHHHAHQHPHHIQHQPQHHHHHIQQHSPTTEDHLLMQAAAAGFMNPNMYWPNQPVSEPIACELYMN